MDLVGRIMVLGIILVSGNIWGMDDDGEMQEIRMKISHLLAKIDSKIAENVTNRLPQGFDEQLEQLRTQGPTQELVTKLQKLYERVAIVRDTPPRKKGKSLKDRIENTQQLIRLCIPTLPEEQHASATARFQLICNSVKPEQELLQELEDFLGVIAVDEGDEELFMDTTSPVKRVNRTISTKKQKTINNPLSVSKNLAPAFANSANTSPATNNVVPQPAVPQNGSIGQNSAPSSSTSTTKSPNSPGSKTFDCKPVTFSGTEEEKAFDPNSQYDKGPYVLYGFVNKHGIMFAVGGIIVAAAATLWYYATSSGQDDSRTRTDEIDDTDLDTLKIHMVEEA